MTEQQKQIAERKAAALAITFAGTSKLAGLSDAVDLAFLVQTGEFFAACGLDVSAISNHIAETHRLDESQRADHLSRLAGWGIPTEDN